MPPPILMNGFEFGLLGKELGVLGSETLAFLGGDIVLSLQLGRFRGLLCRRLGSCRGDEVSLELVDLGLQLVSGFRRHVGGSTCGIAAACYWTQARCNCSRLGLGAKLALLGRGLVRPTSRRRGLLSLGWRRGGSVAAHNSCQIHRDVYRATEGAHQPLQWSGDDKFTRRAQPRGSRGRWCPVARKEMKMWY